MTTANGIVVDYIINADHDVITCPGCRTCVGVGQLCPCPMNTYGPKVESALTRLVADAKQA